MRFRFPSDRWKTEVRKRCPPPNQAHSGAEARSLLSVTIPTLASEVSPARWLSQEYGRDFCAKIPAAQVMGRGPTQHPGPL